MDELKEKAKQYHEGLITTREFLLQVINLLTKHREAIDDLDCNDRVAVALAMALIRFPKID